MTFGRKDYEQQGAEILSTGIESFCSADAIIEVVIRMARDNSSRFASILDVGCGAYPSYSREIAAMGKRVHGVDFSFNYLRLAQRSAGNIKFAQADATQLPFHDGAFDAAICSETAEHIPDDRAVVREIARVLKPGGLLFFTVPNLWNASRIIEMIKALDSRVRLFEQHLREYSPRQVHRLLAPWFTLERSYPVGFRWRGPLGGPIDKMVTLGLLRRFSASIAVVGRRDPSATLAQ
jgi:ubiquinone/menaquinone biosynthesis C-methylase UbiE